MTRKAKVLGEVWWGLTLVGSVFWTGFVLDNTPHGWAAQYSPVVGWLLMMAIFLFPFVVSLVLLYSLSLVFRIVRVVWGLFRLIELAVEEARR